jgi:hypothetical protein
MHVIAVTRSSCSASNLNQRAFRALEINECSQGGENDYFQSNSFDLEAELTHITGWDSVLQAAERETPASDGCGARIGPSELRGDGSYGPGLPSGE